MIGITDSDPIDLWGAEKVAGLSESGGATPTKQNSPPSNANRTHPEDDLTELGESGDIGQPSDITLSASAVITHLLLSNRYQIGMG